jgi:hypothetical protein
MVSCLCDTNNGGGEGSNVVCAPQTMAADRRGQDKQRRVNCLRNCVFARFTLKHDNSVSFWVQDKAFFYNCKFLARNSPTTKAIAFIVGLFYSLFNKIRYAITLLFLSLYIFQYFIYCMVKQLKEQK